MADVTSVPADPPPRRITGRRVVTWVVSACALGFVAWVVPFKDRCTPAGCEPGLLTTVQGANVVVLVAMFGLYLIGTLVWAARWRVLLNLADVQMSFFDVWRATIEAQAGGILLPGGVAGDALRVTAVKGKNPDADLAKIVASIFADRVVGLVTLATIAVAAALLSGGGKVGPSLELLGAIPVGAAVAWVVLSRPALARHRFLSRGLPASVVRPMLEYAGAKGGPRALGIGLVLSLGVSGSQLFIVRGLVAALHVDPSSEAWVYVGGTFAMIVGALPFAPGGWGTADMAYVFFLGQAGVGHAEAAAVCLLHRMFWYATGLLGAGSALSRRH